PRCSPKTTVARARTRPNNETTSKQTFVILTPRVFLNIYFGTTSSAAPAKTLRPSAKALNFDGRLRPSIYPAEFPGTDVNQYVTSTPDFSYIAFIIRAWTNHMNTSN